MNLSYFPNDLFDNLDKLTELNISGNCYNIQINLSWLDILDGYDVQWYFTIYFIVGNNLQQYPNLPASVLVVDVSQNQMSKIPQITILHAVETIHMTGNPIDCDRTLCWVVYAGLTAKIQFECGVLSWEEVVNEDFCSSGEI